MSSPDYEADLVARLVGLLPAVYSSTGASPSLWVGDERRPGARVPHEAAFVRAVTSRSHRYNARGQAREVDLQVLMRHADGVDARAAAEARARTTYDALHLSGPFTGASGTAYLGVECIDIPVRLEPTYFSLNVTLWVDA
jgi:hypothetical protein